MFKIDGKCTTTGTKKWYVIMNMCIRECVNLE